MSAMGDVYTAIQEAIEAEGGITVASAVLGLLQELPVNIADNLSVPLLIDAIEFYIEESER